MDAGSPVRKCDGLLMFPISMHSLLFRGPKALEILRKLTDEKSIPEKYYHAVFDGEVAGIPCIVSKTGYTGEDGVELYLAAEYAPQMWNALLEAGKEEGLIPCGLGARDTLRMEAAMPPLRTRDERRSDSTGSGDFSLPSRWQKKILSGRRRWKKRGEPKRERIGLKVTGRGIIREEQKVSLEGNEIGMTTSGTPLSRILDIRLPWPL